MHTYIYPEAGKDVSRGSIVKFNSMYTTDIQICTPHKAGHMQICTHNE